MAILLQQKNLDNIDFDENMGFCNIQTTYFTPFKEG